MPGTVCARIPLGLKLQVRSRRNKKCPTSRNKDIHLFKDSLQPHWPDRLGPCVTFLYQKLYHEASELAVETAYFLPRP